MMHSLSKDTVDLPGRSSSAVEHSIRCPSCHDSSAFVFHELRNVPVNSCLLLKTRAEACAFQTGNIDLSFCPNCGFIFNAAFESDKTEYSARYEETQSFSGTFNDFHRDLALKLIRRYGITDRTVLEIGCGKGEFLLLLSELGNNRGIGFDPGAQPDRLSGPATDRLSFVRDFYSAKRTPRDLDFVVCKMTLEHVSDPMGFLTEIRKGTGPGDPLVFIQVPETKRILRACAFEDIYYEHCSYYCPGSLVRTFERAGFAVVDLWTDYDDQYLMVTARAGAADRASAWRASEDVAELHELVGSFAAHFRKKVGYWKKLLKEKSGAGRRVVLWGSGSKAVSFLTSSKLGDFVDYVVDINPNRQGHFMAGTGHRIVLPQRLTEEPPDAVIVMNRVYEREIREQLSRLGLEPSVLTL